MYGLRVLQSAHDDLTSILTYISDVLDAPIAAENMHKEVNRCYELLRHNPLSHGLFGTDKQRERGYRRAFIRNYILVYLVNEQTKEVVVQRFFHGSQDYVNLLR